ncbi:TetR/AcrR family transcriptional regulator [Dehalococcoides mccartyi]|nr:TetR/AcrR family transcriptional regulator [Dehalococcoides mccartyi]
MMDGFEKRKTQSKEAILRVALELFEQHGFSRVCIPEIARQAGVSPVTVYNHFGNKEALIKEIFKVFLDNLLDSYRKIIEAKMPFEEKLETLFFSQEALTQQYQGELMETSAKHYPVIQEYIDNY